MHSLLSHGVLPASGGAIDQTNQFLLAATQATADLDYWSKHGGKS